MESITLKPKKSTIITKGSDSKPIKKTDKKPKVILGSGTKYGWVSDTLFDEDLKGW